MKDSKAFPFEGWRPVEAEFFVQDVWSVAQGLLGKILVSQHPEGVVAVRLTEVEAYGGTTDRACHAYGGRCTNRTRPMYAIGGTLYIYLCYGMHTMLNFVTGPEGEPCAVLIRSGEPLGGVELMQQRRRTKDLLRLTVGPGRLTQALAISLGWSGQFLIGHSHLSLWEDDFRPDFIAAGPRIGVAYAGPDANLPWRYWIGTSAFVSQFPEKNPNFA